MVSSVWIESSRRKWPILSSHYDHKLQLYSHTLGNFPWALYLENLYFGAILKKEMKACISPRCKLLCLWHAVLVWLLGRSGSSPPSVKVLNLQAPHVSLSNWIFSFQINSKSELAVRYNNDSPLENHHFTVSLEILNKSDCNIFENVPNERFSIHQVRVCFKLGPCRVSDFSSNWLKI